MTLKWNVNRELIDTIYTATGTHQYRIIRSEYANTRGRWTLIWHLEVDGDCNDAFDTLREAKAAAEESEIDRHAELKSKFKTEFVERMTEEAWDTLANYWYLWDLDKWSHVCEVAGDIAANYPQRVGLPEGAIRPCDIEEAIRQRKECDREQEAYEASKPSR